MLSMWFILALVSHALSYHPKSPISAPHVRWVIKITNESLVINVFRRDADTWVDATPTTTIGGSTTISSVKIPDEWYPPSATTTHSVFQRHSYFGAEVPPTLDVARIIIPATVCNVAAPVDSFIEAVIVPNATAAQHIFIPRGYPQAALPYPTQAPQQPSVISETLASLQHIHGFRLPPQVTPSDAAELYLTAAILSHVPGVSIYPTHTAAAAAAHPNGTAVRGRTFHRPLVATNITDLIPTDVPMAAPLPTQTPMAPATHTPHTTRTPTPIYHPAPMSAATAAQPILLFRLPVDAPFLSSLSPSLAPRGPATVSAFVPIYQVDHPSHVPRAAALGPAFACGPALPGGVLTNHTVARGGAAPVLETSGWAVCGVHIPRSSFAAALAGPPVGVFAGAAGGSSGSGGGSSASAAHGTPSHHVTIGVVEASGVATVYIDVSAPLPEGVCHGVLVAAAQRGLAAAQTTEHMRVIAQNNAGRRERSRRVAGLIYVVFAAMLVIAAAIIGIVASYFGRPCGGCATAAGAACARAWATRGGGGGTTASGGSGSASNAVVADASTPDLMVDLEPSVVAQDARGGWGHPGKVPPPALPPMAPAAPPDASHAATLGGRVRRLGSVAFVDTPTAATPGAGWGDGWEGGAPKGFGSRSTPDAVAAVAPLVAHARRKEPGDSGCMIWGHMAVFCCCISLVAIALALAFGIAGYGVVLVVLVVAAAVLGSVYALCLRANVSALETALDALVVPHDDDDTPPWSKNARGAGGKAARSHSMQPPAMRARSKSVSHILFEAHTPQAARDAERSRERDKERSRAHAHSHGGRLPPTDAPGAAARSPPQSPAASPTSHALSPTARALSVHAGATAGSGASGSLSPSGNGGALRSPRGRPPRVASFAPGTPMEWAGTFALGAGDDDDGAVLLAQPAVVASVAHLRNELTPPPVVSLASAAAARLSTRKRVARYPYPLGTSQLMASLLCCIGALYLIVLALIVWATWEIIPYAVSPRDGIMSAAVTSDAAPPVVAYPAAYAAGGGGALMHEVQGANTERALMLLYAWDGAASGLRMQWAVAIATQYCDGQFRRQFKSVSARRGALYGEFIKMMRIQMGPYALRDWRQYESQNDWFIRSLDNTTALYHHPTPAAYRDASWYGHGLVGDHLPPSMAVGSEDPAGVASVFVSPADARTVVYPRVSDALRVWLKGAKFTVSDVIGGAFAAEVALSAELAALREGSMLVSRLAPQDYHRFHSPARVRLRAWHEYSGTYWSVSSDAVRSDNDAFLNKRHVIVFDVIGPTGAVIAHQSPLVYVAIGATCVGSVIIQLPDGTDADPATAAGAVWERGSLLGKMQFGGSTVVTLTRRHAVRWDDDVIRHSAAEVELWVPMGQPIGELV